ncbi:MAG: hypothetical protein HUJ98_10670 [Bacteroidaceae bacterium]|nr:hypothetical protein [Bacteroidaceae bacterium]
MKNLLFLAAVMALAACGSSVQRQEVAEPEYEYISPTDFFEEENVSGIVTAVDAQSVSIFTESGDTCTFSLQWAEENGKIFGGCAVDDHIVVVRGSGDNADEVVNVTTLVGRWVRKNVADEESGINIQEGGLASSINNDTQTYHRWEMMGNKLLLTWSGDGSDGTSELVDTCEIRALDRNTLTLTSQYEEVLETTYYRQDNPY